MTKKRIYLNAFDMNCVGHQSPGLWTHEEDKSDKYKDLEYWTELAQLLERGRFDALFLADILGVYDVYEGSRDAAVRQGAQTPVNDPLLVIPAMAQVTKHLGFGVTHSVTYEHPYAFARRLSTLDHLTKGRVAWNIVTSYLDSAARNFGLDQQINHNERYDRAEEYMDVCYKLWESSWEEDAVVKDKKNKIYAHPEKVHDINHHGKYFRVPGAHMCEPSPQRTPVLYQAGTSPRGRDFAAKHTECVFTSGPTAKVIKRYVDDINDQAVKNGRKKDQLRFFVTFTPIVAETEELAWEKYRKLLEHVSYEGALALFAGTSGIDLSQYDPDQTLEHVESNAIQTAVDVFTKADPNKKWTVREIAEHVGIGGRGPVAVGSPEQIADTMEEWVNEAGIDGFNIAYATTPGTFKDFVELVVPILQERGFLPKDYEEGTYREKLFGEDQAHLHEDHYGSQFKR